MGRVRYKHLCDFSHFQNCDNYVITPSNVCKILPRLELVRARPKISPEGHQFLQLILYIYTYTIYIRVAEITTIVSEHSFFVMLLKMTM